MCQLKDIVNYISCKKTNTVFFRSDTSTCTTEQGIAVFLTNELWVTYFVLLNFSFFFLIECIIYSLHSFRVIIRLTASDGAFQLLLIMLMVGKQSEPTVRPKEVKTEIPVIPSLVFVILALFVELTGKEVKRKRRGTCEVSLETSPLLKKDAHSRLENHELVHGVTGPKARYNDSSQIWSLEIRHRQAFHDRQLFMIDPFSVLSFGPKQYTW